MKAPGSVVQMAALAVLALVIYYPALHAPLNPLDDRAIINWLFSLEGTGLTDLFTRSSDYYYRPLLLATYWLDWKLWGAGTSFMHLENILLHTANVLLVFCCARETCRLAGLQTDLGPFAIALLFAVHPINTEAVCWIAGRSDLLAGLFVLTAAWLLLRGLVLERSAFAWYSLLPLAAGFYAKETAVFFLPAALAIILLGDSGPAITSQRFSIYLRRRIGFLFPFLVLLPLYLTVRLLALPSGDAGFGLAKKFLADAQFNLLSNLHTAITGIGFYTRKLVWPWPLNFTIDHVPPGYFWVGLLVLAGLSWLIRRRGVDAGLALATACLGASAILALLLRPAWTPVAERYLYIPAAFFCLSWALPMQRWLGEGLRQRWVGPALLAGFVMISVTTVQRTLVWQDNIRLMEDAVRKSPDFPFVRSVLADLYIEAGRVEEGRAIIRTLRAPEGMRNADSLDLKRAQLLFEEGRLQEARATILSHRRKGQPLYYLFQQLLAKVDSALWGELDESERQEIFMEAVEVHRELYTALRDPFYLYQLAKLYLQAGDKTNAAELFAQAAKEAPASAHYRAAAAKLAVTMVTP